jgi:hypothetical protein
MVEKKCFISRRGAGARRGGFLLAFLRLRLRTGEALQAVIITLIGQKDIDEPL